MPKKAGEDTRGAKAKEQKARSAAEKKERDDAAKRAAEEAEWAQGANARALKKKHEEEVKRAEAEARKATAAAQLAAEEAALGRGGKGLRGAERVAATRALRMEDLALKMEAASISESLEARSVDAAISMLAEAHDRAPAAERHPERRMKSAYAAFEERELPALKEENPGLRLSQLKNLLQKMWKKSPENPMNQDHVAYNAAPGAGAGDE